MEKESVWLGPLRKPVRWAMLGFIGLAVLIYVGLILNRFMSSDAIGMYEMIRPRGRPIVAVMLVAVSGAVLFSALYLSDFIGAIEDRPRGFFDILSLVTSRLAMISIAFIVFVMFYEVVARYVFSRPTLWANELSLWIAAFVLLFAGQYAMQQRSHIRIYVIYDLLPRWVQKTADAVSVLLIWVFAFALVWGGYNDAVNRMLHGETFGTAWDPPIPATVKPAILVIICLVALQSLSNLIADWKKAPESHSPMDDIDEAEIAIIRHTLED